MGATDVFARDFAREGVQIQRAEQALLARHLTLTPDLLLQGSIRVHASPILESLCPDNDASCDPRTCRGNPERIPRKHPCQLSPRTGPSLPPLSPLTRATVLAIFSGMKVLCVVFVAGFCLVGS